MTRKMRFAGIEEPMTPKRWKKLTPAKKVEFIVASCDETRIDNSGGYPSQYILENGKIYWATMDGGKEYNAPELVVRPVEQFIEEHKWVEEFFDED